MTQNDQDLWDQARQQGNGNDPYNEPTVAFSQVPDPYVQGTTPFSQGPQPMYGQGNIGQGMAQSGTVPQGATYSPQMAMPANTTNKGTATPKKSGKIRKWLLVASGVLVLVLLAVWGFVLLPALMAKANNQASATIPSAPPVSTPATTGKVATKNVYTPYLANYRTSIRTQIAQGLHLTIGEMNTQLEAGKTLSSIATAQGVTASQLQTLITNTFQNAFQPAINSQGLTQKQVTALINRMIKQPQVLDRYLTVKVRKGAATPVATPAQ